MKQFLSAALVVPGLVTPADVVNRTEATTVQGSKIEIKVKEGMVMIDGAHVVTAKNGVIHVIDKVILP
jgi:transforming growth factor-beta-induced protein